MEKNIFQVKNENDKIVVCNFDSSIEQEFQKLENCLSAQELSDINNIKNEKVLFSSPITFNDFITSTVSTSSISTTNLISSFS